MRKIRSLILILLGVFFLLVTPHPVIAGPQCDALEGTCRIGMCLDEETSKGRVDCFFDPQGWVTEVCCVKGEAGCKKDLELCNNPGECCSGRCEGDRCLPVVAPPPPPAPGGCDDGEIQTAIGPINVCSPQDFVASILKLAIGIGGGIAMLLIIFGGIQILTSAGNPEKVKAGKELITSAIAGLLLIVFSVFILRIIGVEILDIFE